MVNYFHTLHFTPDLNEVSELTATCGVNISLQRRTLYSLRLKGSKFKVNMSVYKKKVENTAIIAHMPKHAVGCYSDYR